MLLLYNDCNDNNKNILLGALKLCYGRENDCDWEECAVDITIWFVDTDEDGLGHVDVVFIVV